MKTFTAFKALVSILALAEPAFGAPITEATLKTFFASIKLDDIAINKLKQLRGTKLACGTLEHLKAQQVETKGSATYEKDRTAFWYINLRLL